MKKSFLLLIVVLLGAGLSLSVTGETAITVFDIEPGVRALGMGGAAVSLVGGAETLYHNAAGLAELSGISLNSFYASHLGLASYSAFGLTFRNWGLCLLTLNSGNIVGYDADGSTTNDDLSFGNTGFIFGFGVDPSQLPFLPALPFDFSLGGRIKYLSAINGETKGSGFAFDLAYRMELGDMRLGPVSLSDIGLGVTATNLFGSLNYNGHSESLGMDLRLGASTRVIDTVMLAADLQASGGFHLGVEYKPARTFAIRSGILTQAGGISLTLGLGIDVEGFTIDYAYVSHPNLGGSHRVSLTIDFSAIDLTAIGRSLRRILP